VGAGNSGGDMEQKKLPPIKTIGKLKEVLEKEDIHDDERIGYIDLNGSEAAVYLWRDDLGVNLQ
jgi:hypothetical protein